MNKYIRIFLFLVFMSYMVTPTIVSIMVSGIDYSNIYTIAEEEQNSEERKFGEKPTKLISKFFFFELISLAYHQKKIPDFFINHWGTVYFDLHIPPPEQV